MFGLFVKVSIEAGMDRPLGLTFPPIPPVLRRQGRQLADAPPRPRYDFSAC